MITFSAEVNDIKGLTDLLRGEEYNKAIRGLILNLIEEDDFEPGKLYAHVQITVYVESKEKFICVEPWKLEDNVLSWNNLLAAKIDEIYKNILREKYNNRIITTEEWEDKVFDLIDQNSSLEFEWSVRDNKDGNSAVKVYCMNSIHDGFMFYVK